MSPVERRVLKTLVEWPHSVHLPEYNGDPYCVGIYGEPIGLPSDHRVKVKSHFAMYYNNGDIYNEHVPFARVQSSFRAVYAATERYKHPDVLKEDLPNWLEFREVMENLKKVYDFTRGGTPVDFQDTVVNPDSSIGRHLKQLGVQLFREGLLKRPWRNKGDFYASVPHLIPWYKQFAWVFKIPVLWTTSGKAEILKEKKVNNGVIRTFTYADPLFTLNYCNMISGFKTLMMLHANNHDNSPSRMGVSFAHGGFDEMMRRLENRVCVKGDCKFWDAGFSTICNEAQRGILRFSIGCEHPCDQRDELDYYVDQAFKSFMIMPGGQVLELLYKKSGDPMTTPGNTLAHTFILTAHLTWVAKEMDREFYMLYLKQRWNLYADDHLNGYSDVPLEYLTFEHRSRFYNAVGQILHPDQDRVQNGPVGMDFLGATCNRKYGKFVPSYDFHRLLAILHCNSYGPEEMEQVLASISGLVQSNPKALEVYRHYVQTYYPRLVPLLSLNSNLFFGGEGGIKREDERQ